MSFIKNGQLQDKKIIAALHRAAEDYEEGAIIETRDLLQDIVDAIDEFSEREERRWG